MKHLLIAILMFFSCVFSFAQTNRAQWLEDDRFGMFIHWGLYSATEGIWKGERLRHPNNYAEWIRYRNRIGEAEYGELAKRFDWDKINPEEWVLLAKKAGMKYIIITSKHHDGVALWDTQVGDYSLPKLSGSNRDVIKEIADACKKHQIKLCFYYSHWIDWQHPYGWSHNQEVTGRVTDQQYNQYWQEKVIPQVRELLTNYGDIAMMWFDMWIPYQQSIIKKEQLDQLATMIHQLQPNCLINSRLGFPIENEHVDFETLGDNQFGSAYTDHIWETPGTIAHSWGFNALENEWKSTNQLFQSLINNVSLNGSYTLNIGPRADGSVPYEGVQRLEDMGECLQKYGKSVYKNKGLPIRFSQHDWGKMTINDDTKELFLHVYNWPLDKILRVTGISSKPKKIEVLNGDNAQEVKFEQFGPILHIKVPEKQPDPYVSVLKVTLNDLQLDKEVVAESTFGGFSLNAKNTTTKNLEFKAFDGTKPDHLVLKPNEKVQWKVYLPEAGKYTVESSIHNGAGKDVKLTIKEGDNTLSTMAKPNGKVTVEPNENWYVEEFLDVTNGKITISNPKEIVIEFSADQAILFNRIWLERK
ncbi:alpha-L-fucosidase [Sphingobacterium daejeonense]|uniref:alpha-L-fucosidase n=1 Tax=Sphingobacterium daejeonense TaxID=371142 RepID=A0ABW3RQN8_9SPHI